ncbi:MAG: putative lipid II flippase FtsW [Rickettsiales bacterium]|nr:putative lipid II flippase FtsW [Rickettsiales bacterium]
MESWEINSHQIFDRRHLSFFKRWWLDIDKINFLIVLAIMFFGLMMTASSSPAITNRIGVEKFFFLKKQIIFAIIAIFILISISFLDQDRIKLFSFLGLVFMIFMMVLVLFFGAEAKGAKRWISFAGFTLQPSEFAKAFFVIFNAYILQKYNGEHWYIRYGGSFLLFLIIAVLLLLQPDFGMTITFAALWLAQIFLYGLPLMLIVALGFMAVMLGVGAYVVFPHVENRINRFLDADGKNYQVERSLDAFVNGSFFGTGPGNGVVKEYIPDAHTDFVFAVVAEEYGIFACTFLIIVFAYLITRIVKRTYSENNLFVYLALCGLIMQFTMQSIVNIGVSMKLLPTKGMTLPFISYGGSSMLSTAICFGLILAFTRRQYHEGVDYGNMKMM